MNRRWVDRVPRRPVQIFSLLLLNAGFIPGLKRIPCLTLNCQLCGLAVFGCPLRFFQRALFGRQNLNYAFVIVGVAGLLIGRLSCGWLCPFGFLQDLLYKLKTPKWRLSNRFGWTKYVVLVVLIGIVPYLTAETWFCRVCPAGVLEAQLPAALLNAGRLPLPALFTAAFSLGIVILAVCLVWMVFSKRPFCRFVCPLGAVLALFDRVSLLQIRVDKESCRGCGQCRRVCPVDIRWDKREGSSQCLRCLECVRACPQKAITVSHIFSKIKTKSFEV